MKLDILNKNFNLKVLALILAFFLWFYVQSQSPFTELASEINLIADLKAINMPDQMVALNLPDRIKLTVKGSPQVIDNIKPEYVEAYVDLAGKKGVGIPVRVEVKCPPGIKITEIFPSQVFVTLDKIEEKEFKVEVEVKGKPQKGFTEERPYLQPESVILEGPRTFLSKVKGVKITAFIGGAQEDLIQKVEPQILDADGLSLSGIESTPDKVQVIVPVRAEYVIKDLSVLPSISGVPPTGFAIESIVVVPPEVTVSVPRNKRIFFLKTASVKVNRAKSSFNKKVKIIVPSDVILTDQKYVQVVIKIKSDRWR